MTTESAPSGIGAPVMMREDVPGVTGRVGTAPATISSSDVQFGAAVFQIGAADGVAIDD